MIPVLFVELQHSLIELKSYKIELEWSLIQVVIT